MSVTDIDKSKLITTFNRWIVPLKGEEDSKVSNEMKLFLMSAFPDMLEEAFPQKKGLFAKLRDSTKKLDEEEQE